ncbi:uveal autoantigen with coiled-coil domains and ankyrin repeats-like [Dipodomys merriami]|uniref:uveal autoantigen with coiled-coil domains and ankyrin repeats-like n=1 Tax=Dipodomys merriami TaxID=94247 RepID=UPI00384F50D8
MNLENTQNQMESKYISLGEHETKLGATGQRLKEAQDASDAILADYKQGQEGILTLHAEIKAQKEQLAEQAQKCHIREAAAKKSEQENIMLKKEIATLQKELKDTHALLGNAQEMERSLGRKTEELNRQVEVRENPLNSTIEKLKEELKIQQRCYEKEQQLDSQRNSPVTPAEHLQIKKDFEKEIGIIKVSLRVKEEDTMEEVSKLQTEIQSTNRHYRN